MSSKNKFYSMGAYMIGITSKGHQFYFDIEDFDLVSQYTWRKNVSGKIQTTIDDKVIQIHRMIMNAKNNEEVDHKDLDKANNRRNNLRLCTSQQNSFNKVKQKRTCTSKYKGVYYEKLRSKWRLYIKLNYKRIHLGYFVSEIEAAKTYNKAAIKYHGEFANLNIV